MAIVTVTTRVSGMDALLRACAMLPEDADATLRASTVELTERLAGRIRAAGQARGPQTARASRTTRATHGALPAVEASHPLVFATEFGMNRRVGWYSAGRYVRSEARQAPRHRGAGSYWFFTTEEKNRPETDAALVKAADDVLARWASG